MLPEAPPQDAAQKQPPATGAKSPSRPSDAPVWLQRSSLALLVVTCIYIGLLLVILPWSHYWQDNRFFAFLPERWVDWLQLGSVRGVVSGLGLMDIWIGLSEAVHWRSRR
jgi:hypothetical protein